jgi:hypothetical protein
MSKSEILAASVDVKVVSGLMAARAPGLVDEDSDKYPLFQTTVGGVAREVAPLAGSVPQEGAEPSERWELALWAVALGVAASIEGSLYPEQNELASTSQAQILTARYQAVLEQLRGHIEGDDGADTDSVPPPLGSFPPAPSYPDPAFGYAGGYYGGGRFVSGSPYNGGGW